MRSHFTARGPSRSEAKFLGGDQIVFDGGLEARFELRHRLAVERDNVIDVKDAPDDDLGNR